MKSPVRTAWDDGETAHVLLLYWRFFILLLSGNYIAGIT